MIEYWVSFVVIAIIILIGGANANKWVLQHSKTVITSETKKQINTKIGAYIMFYWLCDLFYMACFINNLICKFIFGGLIMVILFINLSNIVSLPKKRKFIETFFIIQDFIIGVMLSIYLIYIIPNIDIRNIAITVVSAIYGGLITLVGVSLTIKKAEQDRKEDEINKARPLIFIMSEEALDSDQAIVRLLYSNYSRGTLSLTKEKTNYYTIPQLNVINSDYSYSTIIGFKINNDYHLYDMGQILPKSTSMILFNDFKFNYKDDIKEIALLLTDMLDNIYELGVNFSIQPCGEKNEIHIFSGFDIKKTSLIINHK